MWRAINDDDGMGVGYRIKGYDIIGKTGTAQIASTNGKGYLTGNSNVIRSVALMFPKDDPQIIIYAVAKKCDTAALLINTTKDIIKNIAKYYNIYNDDTIDKDNVSYQIENFTNKTITHKYFDIYITFNII